MEGGLFESEPVVLSTEEAATIKVPPLPTPAPAVKSGILGYTYETPSPSSRTTTPRAYVPWRRNEKEKGVETTEAGDEKIVSGFRVNSGSPTTNYGTSNVNEGIPAFNYGNTASDNEAPNYIYGTNYGPTTSNYGTTTSNYGTPSSNYGTPGSNSETPGSNSGTPAPNYGNSAANYGTPTSSFESPVNSFGNPASYYNSPVVEYGKAESSVPRDVYGTSVQSIERPDMKTTTLDISNPSNESGKITLSNPFSGYDSPLPEYSGSGKSSGGFEKKETSYDSPSVVSDGNGESPQFNGWVPSSSSQPNRWKDERKTAYTSKDPWSKHSTKTKPYGRSRPESRYSLYAPKSFHPSALDGARRLDNFAPNSLERIDVYSEPRSGDYDNNNGIPSSVPKPGFTQSLVPQHSAPTRWRNGHGFSYLIRY